MHTNSSKLFERIRNGQHLKNAIFWCQKWFILFFKRNFYEELVYDSNVSLNYSVQNLQITGKKTEKHSF